MEFLGIMSRCPTELRNRVRNETDSRIQYQQYNKAAALPALILLGATRSALPSHVTIKSEPPIFVIGFNFGPILCQERLCCEVKN